MNFRTVLKKTDIPCIKEILESTGFFYEAEIEIALGLVHENINKGEEKSGYFFILAEESDKPTAFSCFGPIPGTESSYDLYWIAVKKSHRGKGIGKILMNLSRKNIRERGGQNIWIETSSRPLYEPTRQFYISYGCHKTAELIDYYGDKDNKVIFALKSS